MSSPHLMSRLFTFLTLFLTVPAAGLSQWLPANGPYGPGGDVFSFTAVDTFLFAGSNGGVFVSTNNGGNWTNSGLIDFTVTALAVDPGIVSGTTVLIAGTRDNGLYRSTNFGKTWIASNHGLPGKPINALTVMSKETGVSCIFAGTRERGVYVSTDQGVTWNTASSGMIYNTIYSLTHSGFTLIAGSLGGGVYRSTDFGVSWSRTGPDGMTIYALAATSSDVYAGAWGTVYHSTDIGQTWLSLDSNLFLPPVLSLAISPPYVFAGTSSEGICRFSGSSHAWVNSGLSSGNVQALTVRRGDGGDDLFAGTDRGVFLSISSGARWDNTGLTNTYIKTFITTPPNLVAPLGTLYAGTTGAGIFATTDGGSQWISLNSGLTDRYISSLLFVPTDSGFTKFLAGTTYNGVYQSSDTGRSWKRVDTNMNISIRAMLRYGSSIFAGSWAGIYRSDDGGNSWNPIIPGPANPYIFTLDTCAGIIFAGSWAGIFRSADSGAHWAAANNGLWHLNIISFAVSHYGVIAAGTYGGGVFRSSDLGAHWTAVNAGLTSRDVRTLLFTGRTLLAGCNNGSVARLEGEDTTWTMVDTGLGSTGIMSLALSPDEPHTLFAGTFGNGVWMRPLNEITAIHTTDAGIPSSFTAGEGYPNPFNPSTTISVVTNRRSHVTVGITDILGREVAVLLDDEKPAGKYSVTWNADGMSGGVYFCRIRSGSQWAVRKLVLLR